MDDHKQTTEITNIPAHGTTFLEVVYTNEEHTVERILAKYEQWIEEEKHWFVGLDLEYTRDRRQIAVMQLAMRQHVLVFHWCRSLKRCEALRTFFRTRISLSQAWTRRTTAACFLVRAFTFHHSTTWTSN